MKRTASRTGESHSKLMDAQTKEPPDWRGETLSRIRDLIKQADPEVVEEVKWMRPANPAVLRQSAPERDMSPVPIPLRTTR